MCSCMIPKTDTQNQQQTLPNQGLCKNQLNQIFDFLHDNDLPPGVEIGLAEISEDDKKWDYHRSDTQTVGDIFGYNPDFQKWSERMAECSTFLLFKQENDAIKLTQSYFCHVRHCPVCQWRKSLYWKAMLHRALDNILPQYPSHRFIFLTLTYDNCPIGDLRDTLKHMNQSWKRLIERDDFTKVVVGWVRATEVTRDKKRPNEYAHPHFHAILMVKSNYFTKNYIKHEKWLKLWQESLRVEHWLSVGVKAVRPKQSAIENGTYMDGVRHAVAEVMKYSVKPSDMMGDMSLAAHKWFYEFCVQVKKLRFVSTGGILKDVIKNLDKITDEQMVHVNGETPTDETQEQDKRQIIFRYTTTQRRYIFKGRY